MSNTKSNQNYFEKILGLKALTWKRRQVFFSCQ